MLLPNNRFCGNCGTAIESVNLENNFQLEDPNDCIDDIYLLDNWLKDKEGKYYFYDGHNYYNNDGSYGSIAFYDEDEDYANYYELLHIDDHVMKVHKFMKDYDLDEVEAEDILNNIEDGMEEETAVELLND